MERHRNYGLYAALLATLLIAACGIKPSKLDPPPGAENTPFPKTYPSTK